LLIPAYNEEKIIRQKLENALALDYPIDKLEVLLILDGCTDRTKEIAGKFTDRRIRIIEQIPRRGKVSGLNLAVPQARGEILVFTDANSIYKKDAIKMLVRNFADERIGCVCGRLQYINKSVVGKGENLYWSYERFIKTKESQLRALFVVNGSIYAIRKKLYKPVEETLADDFVTPMRIAKEGLGLVYEPEAVTLERTAESAREGLNQKIRIISQGIKASFAMIETIFSSGPLRVFQFLFHKFIRWLAPLFLILIVISNLLLLGNLFYRIIFFCQILFYLFALIGYFLQEKKIFVLIFNVPFYFCFVNFASLIALIRFSTGRIKGTWEKAETTRR